MSTSRTLFHIVSLFNTVVSSCCKKTRIKLFHNLDAAEPDESVTLSGQNESR